MVTLLQDLGEWHVYVGAAPQDYVSSLQLPAGTVVYHDPRKWLLQAIRSLMRVHGAVLIANPGEISSTRIELRNGIILASLSLLARIFSNPIYRLGIGTRDHKSPFIWGHALSVRLASKNIWRDALSREIFRRGTVAPDWAFALDPSEGAKTRDLVCISYRGDKKLPKQQALTELQGWCDRQGFELVVVSQVKRDVSSHEELAQLLGVRHVHPDSPTLDEFERIAREAYSRSALVLSNRIHVLILAAVEGASLGGVLGHPDVKVERTFRGAGIPFPVHTDSQPGDSLSDYLDGVLAQSPKVSEQLGTARSQLKKLAQSILDKTSAKS